MTGTNPLALNAWHHVAATWDGASIKVYVDGVKEGEVASAATLPSDLGASTAIGAWLDAGNGFFTGSIDEVEIFDRALSDEEIRSIYWAGSAGKIKLEPASIEFFGPRAQPTSFGIPIGNLPVVGVNKTQGTLAYDRNGPTEPFLGSIAYLKQSSPKPTVAPYTMTSVAHSGFPSLDGLAPDQLSYDFTGSNMQAGNVLDKRADPPMSLDDPLFDTLDNVVYFIEDGTGRSMVKRTYVGGDANLIDNNGTPDDGADDSGIASIPVEYVTLFLDYTTGQNTGWGLLTVDPGSPLYDDLTINHGTDKLRMIIDSIQSPVSQDDPGGGTPATEMYAVFESSISLEPL